MVYSVFMLQWNCRSLRANGHWLRTAPELRAHILCLQETFLKGPDTFSLPSKTIYRADRNSARGGGLLTAIASSMASYRVPLPPCPVSDFEALAVMVLIDHCWTLIINVYSPSGTFPEEWLVEVISSLDTPIILLGDLNINLLARTPPIPSRVRSLLDWVNDQELCLLNTNNPTRYSSTGSSSLLDITVMSPNLIPKVNYYVHPDTFDSDHNPIIVLPHPPSRNLDSDRRCPQWISAGEYLNKLDTLPCHSISVFEQVCSKAINETSQVRRGNGASSCPWWDGTCRTLLAEKRRHLRRARASCSREEWLLYKRCSARLRRYLKSAARKFWEALCRESSNTGKIYKILKRLMNREHKSEGNVIRNPDPLASVRAQGLAFLNYFSKETSGQPIPYDLSAGDPELDAPFTLEELEVALHHSRPTSPGEDGISVKLLKNLKLQHIQSLLDSFNLSFDSGDLPHSWKTAMIVPIRKPGKPAHLTNSYRPIALTAACCKVFERMLLRRILSWSGQRQLFHKDQFGFIPLRDSTLALCTLFNDIASARAKNWFVAAICLDIKSAYDSVCPDILIYKLATCGIRGKTGRWIASFLKHRSIKVRWKSVITMSAPCYLGVPQGSVLSPFLFNLYMSDIVETVEDGVQMIIYADDIVVYSAGPREDQSRHKLQDTLRRIQQWCSANGLSIAPSKSTAINFSRRRDPGPTIRLMGEEIPWSSSVKILGVWLSRSLGFTPHFSYVKVKALRRIGYLRAVASRSRGINSSHMIRIVNAIIRSLLEYGAPLFFDSSPTSFRPLDVCYNAALRLASGLPKWTPLPVLRRETGSSNMTSRVFFLTKLFLLRTLASPSGSRFGETVRNVLSTSDSSWKWWRPLKQLQDSIRWPLSNVLQFVWPPIPCSLKFQIITTGLAFQETTLPSPAVSGAWNLWFSSLPPCSFFATDASKDCCKTSIAAVDPISDRASAALIPDCNSVFFAEALAIYFALSVMPVTHPEIFIMSDSLSVLKALDSWSFKSPKIILKLISIILSHSNCGHSITFVWCPGHRGILPNDQADAMAKNGPFMCSSIPWISDEDLRSLVKKNWIIEQDYSWNNCDYATSFPFLLPDRSYPNWVPTRHMDVLMARWRSRTIITNNKLYRMSLTYSPLCSDCYELETPEHILLHCSRLNAARCALFSALGIVPPVSYGDVICAAFVNRRRLSSLVAFSRRAFPGLD